MIVDCAVYADGRRLDRTHRVAGLRAEAAAARGFAWVGLVEPTLREFDDVRHEFELHELAVEDASRSDPTSFHPVSSPTSSSSVR